MFPRGGIKVTCYSGRRADERPTSFTIKEKETRVVEILDRWIGEDHEYFKVRGDDNWIYILRHATGPDLWEIQSMEAGPG